MCNRRISKVTYQGILDGIDLAKREQVEAVIEIGGASAMDTGKAIAFGAVHDNLEESQNIIWMISDSFLAKF